MFVQFLTISFIHVTDVSLMICSMVDLIGIVFFKVLVKHMLELKQVSSFAV